MGEIEGDQVVVQQEARPCGKTIARRTQQGGERVDPPGALADLQIKGETIQELRRGSGHAYGAADHKKRGESQGVLSCPVRQS